MPALLPESLPVEGVEVPLLASFVGIARVPLVALGKNNLSAELRLFPDRLQTKVLRQSVRPYTAIRRVDVLTFFATRNVRLTWKGSLLTFTANIRTDAWRLAVLRLLAAKGAPLSPGARRLLEAG